MFYVSFLKTHTHPCSLPNRHAAMHACRRPLHEYLYTSKHSTLTLHVSLAVAAVPKLSVFSNLQFGGVGGGDAITGLHAVTLLQLRQSAHQTSVGCIQRCYALLLHTHTHIHLRKIYIYRHNELFLPDVWGEPCRSALHSTKKKLFSLLCHLAFIQQSSENFMHHPLHCHL